MRGTWLIESKVALGNKSKSYTIFGIKMFSFNITHNNLFSYITIQ